LVGKHRRIDKLIKLTVGRINILLPMSWKCSFCETINEDASEICQTCDKSKDVSDEVGKHIAQLYLSSDNYRSLMKQSEYATQYGFVIAEKREMINFHKKECSKTLSRVYVMIFLVVIHCVVSLPTMYLLNISIWYVLLANFLLASLFFSLITFFLKDYRYHMSEIRNQQNEVTDTTIAIILNNKDIIEHIFKQREANNEQLRKLQVPDNQNQLLQKVINNFTKINKNQ